VHIGIHDLEVERIQDNFMCRLVETNMDGFVAGKSAFSNSDIQREVIVGGYNGLRKALGKYSPGEQQ